MSVVWLWIYDVYLNVCMPQNVNLYIFLFGPNLKATGKSILTVNDDSRGTIIRLQVENGGNL